MQPLVFVSYASPDRDRVVTVLDDLEADGLDCWMSPRDVPAGQDYAEIIPDVIRQSAIVLLFLSASSNQSDHVLREAHLAIASKLPIMPIRLEDVAPEGALAYMLADVQWIDAFPRVEPSLARIRHEALRLLERTGRQVKVITRRTPFQNVLAGTVAWLTVLGLMLLLLTWIQRTWFNLVPVLRVPQLAVHNAPAVILALAAIPVMALAAQFWVHRNLSRVATLDALFGVAASGARVRFAAAVGLAIIFAAAIWLSPPTVSIRLESTPLEQYNSAFTRAMIGPVRNYLAQCGSHFVVSTRVGSRNPPGHYALRIELTPYATRNGIEFSDLLIDPKLGVTKLEPVPDDRRQAGFVEIDASSLDVIAGERSVRVKMTHYRDATPVDARIAASLELAGLLRTDATAQTIPASLFCAS